MLELKNLSVSLDRFHLQANFSVTQGEMIAVMGASGSGKSTLLNAVAGFQTHSGSVFFEGREISGLAPADRPLSVLFQDGNLFPHLTAAQNVGLGLSPRLKLDRFGWQRVTDALDAVGLQERHDAKPAALSGGQQSRVAIARVLLRAKPLLLLDEPFAALGPALRSEMLALVAHTAKQTGTTVLMVTHAPSDAYAICNQVVVVEDGVAMAPQPTGPLLDNPPAGLRAYLGL